MGNKKISLWQLLEKQSVEIPIIQRDFAQGRAGNEHLRARFLKSLKNALDTSNELVLDFVYGSEASERFQPLDGQQRLTTLWLLHWYIALRAGELSEVGKRLSNFTYETRISSREFCQQLCDANNFNGFDGKDILGFIEKQTWFYSAWKQDPTIRSILRMLGGCRNTTGYGEDNIYDGIEKLFREEDNFEEYWKDLTSDKPVITFYYLSLRDFGLSDDLYIKMNARGKQLTAFENFKADLIGYIGKQAQETKDDDQKEKWQNFLDPEKGIPIKLDTKWTDLFWKNGGDAKSRQVDERFFAFLNRFFLNHKLAEINGEDDKYYSYLTNKGKENDTQIQYQGIEPYLWKKDVKEGSITYGLFDDLNTIMDNYIASDVQPTDFTCEWNKSFRFIPEYKEDKVTSINQVERVVFYAICKYFKQDKVEENTDKQSLKRWMRVVWNLVSVEDSDGGKAIRTVSEMKNSVAIINNLKSHDVYTSMKNESDEYGENDNLLMKQFKEEVFKAKKISEDNNWENKFIDAEKHAFFNGCICFLLRDEDGSWRIDDFERKWDNAQKFFDNEGVTKEYSINAKLLKAFLYHLGKEKAMEENNFIFDHTKETWRNRILIRKNYSEAAYKILTGNLDVKDRTEADASYKALYSTGLIDFIAEHQKGSRIRWIHGRCSIYPKYIQGIMFDNPGSKFYRNSILSKCSKVQDFMFEEWHKIPDCNFFRGWNIRFKHRDNFFEYNFNNYVYLMEKGWSGRATDNSNGNDKELSFQIEQNYSSEEFAAKLDELLKNKRKINNERRLNRFVEDN